MSRIFDEFPDVPCPICKTTTQGKCVLIPIDGTQDGGNVEAKAVHLNCILDNLYIYSSGTSKQKIIALPFEEA